LTDSSDFSFAEKAGLHFLCSMLLTLILFILGFVLLIKGADFLVDGASSVARRFNISELAIGLTIVAFGTSLPELTVNLFASFSGSTDIAIGNVLGSNTANILLILGVAAMIHPLSTQRGTVWKEIPFSLLAVVCLAIMANDRFLDGMPMNDLGRADGLLLIAFFIIFLYYTAGLSPDAASNPEEKHQTRSILISMLMIVSGLIGLIMGGKWIVDGAVEIARFFNMSEALIGLTVIAIGTSLPELATSAVAAYRHQSDIAIGNVVGSNIFNVFWILGVSASIRPLPFNEGANFDIATAVVATLLLFFSLFVGRRHIIDRWQGAVFFMLYVAYTVFLVIRG
jgi:cation:H+ antiporter